MRKIIKISLIVLASVFIIYLIWCFLSLIESEDCTDGGIIYIEEQSSFIGWQLTDSGEIELYYSLCYQNTGDQDAEMTTSLHFPKRKIKKWIKYKRFFDGTVNGNRSFIIPAFETVTVIYVIQAEYTGASLPDKFPMPDEFIFMLRFLK